MELAVTGGIHHLLLLSSVIPSFFSLFFFWDGVEYSQPMGRCYDSALCARANECCLDVPSFGAKAARRHVAIFTRCQAG